MNVYVKSDKVFKQISNNYSYGTNLCILNTHVFNRPPLLSCQEQF